MEEFLQHHLDSKKELENKINKYQNLCNLEKKNFELCVQYNNNNNDICTHLETLLHNCNNFKDKKLNNK